MQASSRGQLEWRTDPPSGSDVRPGQTVAVHLVWDAQDFRGNELRRVLACVTVDDQLESSLGMTEGPTVNDGEFQYTFLVPGNLPEGARVCGRGMVSGADRHGTDKRAVSTDHCLKVVGTTATADQRHDGTAGCPEALQGPANGSLQIQGDIPEGSEVRAGQIVQTWLLWRTADFARDTLDQVVHCVTVNGALDPHLSTAEIPTRNDGEFVQQITIPSDLAAGTRICARGSISGRRVGDPLTSEKSNDLCFKLVDVRPPTPIVANAVPPSSAGGQDTCLDVLDGFPKGRVRRVTNTDVTTVRPGQELEVRLIWNTEDFAVTTLRQALDCVTVDGRLDTSLSIDDRATANNGSFLHRFLVPSGLPAGTRLCDRGFVSGAKANGELDRQKSNDLCFTVAAGAAASTVAQVPAVARTLDAATGTTTAALPELPRTGVPRPELVLAFLAFAAGGSAIVATSRLSRRRKVTSGSST